MSSKTIYYVYAYLRSKDSKTAKAGTPYYIGKGKGNRAYNKSKSEIRRPSNKTFIVLVEQNLTELGALALERRLIRWYGRLDLSSGILRNKTDGGDGLSGRQYTVEQRLAIANRYKGTTIPQARKDKISATLTGRISTTINTKWWNDGKVNKMSSTCPGPKFKIGKLVLGKWWNNGLVEKLAVDPPGPLFTVGRLDRRTSVTS